MRSLQHIPARASFALAAVLALASSAFAGDTGPGGRCFAQFQTELEVTADAARSPSPEIVHAREEIEGDRYDLERRTRDVDERLASLQSERARIDTGVKDLAGTRAHLQHEARLIAIDFTELGNRVAAHDRQAAMQRMCFAGAITKEDYARCVNWADEINWSHATLTEDIRAMTDRQRTFADRKASLDAEEKALRERSEALDKKQARLDADLNNTLLQCEDAVRRAIALHRILGRPGLGVARRREVEQSQQQLADETMKGLVGDLAAQAFVKAAARRSVTAAWAGAPAAALVDMVAAGGIAGVTAKNREIEQDLWLVGDYAAAFQQIVKEKGPDAKRDPGYKALRRELLKRKKTETWQVMLGGYATPEALVGALEEAAGHYVAHSVGHAAKKVVNHLNNAERRALGKGGVVFFREAISVVSTAGTHEFLKGSAEIIERQMNDVHGAAPPADRGRP